MFLSDVLIPGASTGQRLQDLYAAVPSRGVRFTAGSGPFMQTGPKRH